MGGPDHCHGPVLSQNSIVVSVHRSGAGVKLSNLDLRGCRMAGNRAVPNDGHRARLSFGTPREGHEALLHGSNESKSGRERGC